MSILYPMDKIQFENLSLEDKAKLVWEEGTYVETLEYYNAKINLHSIGSVFIEVYYNVSTNEIEKISIADDVEMKKYLNNINHWNLL